MGDKFFNNLGLRNCLPNIAGGVCRVQAVVLAILTDLRYDCILGDDFEMVVGVELGGVSWLEAWLGGVGCVGFENSLGVAE